MVACVCFLLLGFLEGCEEIYEQEMAKFGMDEFGVA